MIAARFNMPKMSTRFLDRPVAEALAPRLRRFLTRAGGAIRTTARRSLRYARKLRLAELTEKQREVHTWQKRMFEAGRGPRPVLPQSTSKRGEVPRLHVKPTSPLKALLFFALDDGGKSVVVGPQSRDGRSLERLERTRPFMEPAYRKIEPRLSEYLSSAVR